MACLLGYAEHGVFGYLSAATAAFIFATDFSKRSFDSGESLGFCVLAYLAVVSIEKCA
jgi:hypothetical protein